MKLITAKTILFVCLYQNLMHAHAIIPQSAKVNHSNEDVSLRFHAQWHVDEGTQKRIYQAYGIQRFGVDKNGHPIPLGLGPIEAKRWNRLYELCMSDGCYYCDANEGSCEQETCGVHNEYCRPLPRT